jgi:hemerythrin superfamily protein
MPDVVDLLLEQHERVRLQFVHLVAATGQQKVELFAGLVEMLHRHEAAEQQIVHPLLGNLDDILTEERDADAAIAELVALGVDDPAFDGKLADLHAAVLAHAAHEEEQEFPALRQLAPGEQLVALASQIRADQSAVW